MYSLVLKVFLGFLFSLSVFSQEGDGGDNEKKDQIKNSAVKAQQEWLELQAKMLVYNTKVKAKEDSVKALIEEKNKTKDPKKAAEAVENLKKEYRELREAQKDFNRVRSLLLYRYPEKGVAAVGDRQYEHIELKSLEELEKQMTLDGRIRKTLSRVRKQYQPPDDMKKDEKPKAQTDKKENLIPGITEPVYLNK